MARPWRIEYEGALYHVFSRKTEGSPIKGLVKRKNTPLNQKNSLFD
jgi:hypothetical protein